MRKRLTLNRAWKLCLDGMWKWIIEQKKAGSIKNVIALKRLWIKENTPDEEFLNECPFCEYKKRNGGNDCKMCPGKLVIKNFNCQSGEYHYYDKPIKFYEKLLWINKRRLNTKKRN